MRSWIHRLRNLIHKTPSDMAPVFSNPGYCFGCDSEVVFVARGTWWRDQYLCSRCGCIPRERALMFCVDKFLPAWRQLKIHESSPVDRGASRRLKRDASGYLPTQFFPGVDPGSEFQGTRCEDLEALTFPDDSIDLHITQDVFEHLLDPAAAFREIARTLRPGGAHVFTTPLVNKHQASELRARRDAQGRIEHLVEPPEYHDSAVSQEGSLVTRHWGYDICAFIHDASGLFTQIVWIDALEYGIRAELIEVLITRKPG